jgi:hypothetical protein
MGQRPSTVKWRDSFLSFDSDGVLSFNITTQVWTRWYIDNYQMSYYLVNNKIVLLPTDEVLIVPAYYGNITFLFNIATKTMSLGGKTAYDQGSAGLVQLGQRFFAIGGLSNVTEEYNYINKTWSIVNTRLINNYFSTENYNYNGPAAYAISVPADLFANLPNGCQGIM